MAYLAAFLGGFLASLVPILSAGSWPSGVQLLAALGGGFLGLHLLGRPAPTSHR